MNFKFSKEIIPTDLPHKSKGELKLYKVTDLEDQLLGTFYYYPKEPTISVGNKEIIIKTISKLFKKTRFLLIDKNTDEQIGEYEILGSFGVNRFWQDVPTTPAGTIKLAETLYNFRRIPPDTQYSILKAGGWSFFKFWLYAIKGHEFYEYSFRIDIPVWNKSSYIKLEPFSGIIESNSINVLPALAGLYLMEVAIEYEDSDGNG